MKQYILLQSYLGLSNFTYEASCTGRPISLKEVLELGLVNRETLERHSQSSYTAVWYEIKAGDEIEVEIRDDEQVENFMFFVPKDGLPNPPVNLDDERVGPRIHEYLLNSCQRVK